MAENKKTNDKTSNEETQQQKRCFVIMPFSDPEGYAPGHFRKVYDQIIKPAVENAGYRAYRVDENGVSDLITTKIFKAILDCDMAICDLSSRNPNVLYELGIRHAFDKPVVLIKDNKTDRIFDIQGITTVEYRRERLYDEVIEDQKNISKAIKANENNSSGYSILNMINLQKATFDTSTKGHNSPEINNALLMRVLDALDKVEQIQNDVFKPNFNNSPFQSASNEYKLNESLSDLNNQIVYMGMVMERFENIGFTPEEIDRLENEASRTKFEIYQLDNNPYITHEQRSILLACLESVNKIINKIITLKRIGNNNS